MKLIKPKYNQHRQQFELTLLTDHYYYHLENTEKTAVTIAALITCYGLEISCGDFYFAAHINGGELTEKWLKMIYSFSKDFPSDTKIEIRITKSEEDYPVDRFLKTLSQCFIAELLVEPTIVIASFQRRYFNNVKVAIAPTSDESQSNADTVSITYTPTKTGA